MPLNPATIAAGLASEPTDAQRLATLQANLKAGTAELRRYVEGNGFTWCEDESTVFNVTTAIGWLGGALESSNRKAEAALLALESAQRERDAMKAERNVMREALENIAANVIHFSEIDVVDENWRKERAQRALDVVAALEPTP